MSLFALFAFGVAAAQPLEAARPNGPFDYETCTDRIDTSPEEARAYAERWLTAGGGDPARHCNALAAIALGAEQSAGLMLAKLAEKYHRSDPATAAQYYGQAAEAFMSAGAKDGAFSALEAAYDVMPDAGPVHMIAAAVYATGEEWDGTARAINALARHAVLSSDAHALRGRAYFEQARYDDAKKDAIAALELDPTLVDAILLRGDLIGVGVKMPRLGEEPVTAAAKTVETDDPFAVTAMPQNDTPD